MVVIIGARVGEKKNQKIWNNMNEIQRDEKDWFIDKNTKQIQSDNLPFISGFLPVFGYKITAHYFTLFPATTQTTKNTN